jgi:hypothetical protein
MVVCLLLHFQEGPDPPYFTPSNCPISRAHLRVRKMEKSYDFSKGERGKFYNKDAKLNIPIYLESENLLFVETIAEKKKTDVSTIVNEMLKTDMQLINQAK